MTADHAIDVLAERLVDREELEADHVVWPRVRLADVTHPGVEGDEVRVRVDSYRVNGLRRHQPWDFDQGTAPADVVKTYDWLRGKSTAKTADNLETDSGTPISGQGTPVLPERPDVKQRVLVEPAASSPICSCLSSDVASRAGVVTAGRRERYPTSRVAVQEGSRHDARFL
jgi:hypothetical protein